MIYLNNAIEILISFLFIFLVLHSYGQNKVEENLVYIEVEDVKGLKYPYGKEALMLKRLEKASKYKKGTGFILEHNKEKYIITCTHTIENFSLIDGSKLKVFLRGGKKIVVSEVVGKDYFTDIALLRIDPRFPLPKQKGLTLGKLPPKKKPVITYGMLSSDTIVKNNGKILDNAKNFSNLYWNLNYIVSDAEIAKGFSGGPLIDAGNNKVVGMNAQVSENKKTNEQTYFFINVETIKKVINDIINSGYVNRKFCGLVFVQSCGERDIDGCDSPVYIHEQTLSLKNRAKIKKYIGWHLLSIDEYEIKSFQDILKVREEILILQTQVKIVLQNPYDNERKEIWLPLNALNNKIYEDIAQIFLSKHNIQQDESDDKEWKYYHLEERPFIIGGGLSHALNYKEQLFSLRNTTDWGKVIWLNSISGYMSLGLDFPKTKRSIPQNLGIFSKDSKIKGIYF